MKAEKELTTEIKEVYKELYKKLNKVQIRSKKYNII